MKPHKRLDHRRITLTPSALRSDDDVSIFAAATPIICYGLEAEGLRLRRSRRGGLRLQNLCARVDQSTKQTHKYGVCPPLGHGYILKATSFAGRRGSHMRLTCIERGARLRSEHLQERKRPARSPR